MVLRQKNPGKKNDDGTINSDVKLSMDYFINHARKKNTGKNETIKDIKNKYKTDFAYGSTNEKVTDVIKAEREVKKDAEAAVYIEGTSKENGILFIKEGTVIGRTYTDEEIFKMRKENPNATEFSSKIELNDDGVAVLKSSENSLVIQGNYLRILMRDSEGSIVENVEDYMKLDPRPSSKLFEVPVIKKIEASESQIQRMAAAIEAETNSSDEYVAFAWLIRNRFENEGFGNSLNSIIDSFDSTEPSDLAINAARSVLNGEIVSPIDNRCYYKESGSLVSAKADPIQVPENTGKIYHYNLKNIQNHDYRNDYNKNNQK